LYSEDSPNAFIIEFYLHASGTDIQEPCRIRAGTMQMLCMKHADPMQKLCRKNEELCRNHAETSLWSRNREEQLKYNIGTLPGP
jgi:hypothetical protein